MAEPERTLEGQVAIVTGASSGIGQGCAVALGRRGAAVVVNFRSDSAGADETVARIGSGGGRAIPVRADVADEADVAALFEAGQATFGAVDILVANAGIQSDAAFTELTREAWDRVVATNLTGVFVTMQHAVRAFRAQGMRSSRALGKIVVMSSVHDTIPWAFHANYAAAKGGVSMLMKSAAQELAPERIRINAVSPGAIATDINRSEWSDPAAAEHMKRLIPYGRIGATEDIGEAVAWLVSDAADYVVGATLVVDGGMELYPEFRGNG